MPCFPVLGDTEYYQGDTCDVLKGQPVVMSALVPIGDFSRMTHLSVKALRF